MSDTTRRLYKVDLYDDDLPDETYFVSLTEDEKAHLQATTKAWVGGEVQYYTLSQFMRAYDAAWGDSH